MDELVLNAQKMSDEDFLNKRDALITFRDAFKLNNYELGELLGVAGHQIRYVENFKVTKKLGRVQLKYKTAMIFIMKRMDSHIYKR